MALYWGDVYAALKCNDLTFQQGCYPLPKNVIINLAVFRTQTLDTTQDMPIETKNINVICPYLAGIMQRLIIFVRSYLEHLAIVNKETRHL